ncbi:tRNA-specific 2-thiouridylase [Ruminococcaceae bacterium YRB3002]|nr:tRNA-specific 2-thiouridylase [Ruminococcaceae bacterium YRB3002]
MTKVVVGMSGGVDSAVAAYLLKEQGYEVIGVTLRTWQGEDGGESRCCEIDDARRTCEILGVRYHPHNCTGIFEDKVVRPFVREYIKGQTPNPCIECNRYVKWAKLMELAQIFEAEYVATGHYAKVVKLPNGRVTVQEAEHAAKDQTYMLYKLTQDQLAHTLMPLGEYTKDEVRRIAEAAGLPCAHKGDSQEICFVTDGKYSDFIAGHAEGGVPGAGNFVDEDGNVLGRHKGIHHYTVGQRKGLGIALGYPAFVTRINPDDNTVVLGGEEALLCSSFALKDVNLLSVDKLPEEGVRCFVKTRYHQLVRPALVIPAGADRAQVIPDDPARGVSPGQSAVFYDGDGMVIGGGIIVHQP